MQPREYNQEMTNRSVIFDGVEMPIFPHGAAVLAKNSSRTSHHADTQGLLETNNHPTRNSWFTTVDGGIDIHTSLWILMRLAAKLRIPITTRQGHPTPSFKKFVRGVNSNFIQKNGRGGASDLSRQPSFTSLDVADPRVAKVKAFLRDQLNRTPTDKDIDTFLYMYLGSDSYSDRDSPLVRGLQNSHYNRSGRHYRKVGNLTSRPNNTRPTPRRNQRRFNMLGRPRRRVQDRFGHPRWGYYHAYGSNSNWSNTNSNSNRSNSNSNSNHWTRRTVDATLLNTTAKYRQNLSRVNADRVKNERANSSNRIKWKKLGVNTFPTDPITLIAFSNGQKAVKIHPTANHYMSPQTFRNMARASMTNVYNRHGNNVLFKNPTTRQNVRRSNIKFVILVDKTKKNAVNKIGDARRRQLTRRKTTASAKAVIGAKMRRVANARAKAVAAALKRKRSQ